MTRRLPSLTRWIAAAVVATTSSGIHPAGSAPASESLEESTTATVSAAKFDRHHVLLGSATRQTVLTGFLLGGPMAELAVVHVDQRDQRHLRIHAFDDGTWVPFLDATLRPGVSFIDVANIDGRDRLLTYETGRLSWFDPDVATERPLVEVTSNFHPPRSGQVWHADVTRDLNHDGLDDLVVPAADGFRVFVQRSDGAFADPVTIQTSTDLAGIYGADGYRYDPWSQGGVHEVDHDRDGLSDLVFWSEDQFAVHYQGEDGLFAPTADSFTTNVAFDSDDLHSLASGDMTGRVLHSLADANGDGVADLVTYTLEGRTISRKRASHEVHFGMPAPDGGTAFSESVDTTIQSDRIQLGMDLHDFDRDGQVDLMLTTIKRGFLRRSLGKRFYGFMGGEVRLHLEFYRMDEGRYADQPNAVRRIDLQFPGAHQGPGWVPLDLALRGGKHEGRSRQGDYCRAFNYPLLIGDVNGDGHADLLIGWTHEQLPSLKRPRADLFDVFYGVPGPGLFSGRPTPVAVPMPIDDEYTWLVDLDQDGRQDILLHYPSSIEPHQVTMLMAR